MNKRTLDAYARTPYTLQSAKALVEALLEDPDVGDVQPFDSYTIATASIFAAGEFDEFMRWVDEARAAHFAALGRPPPPTDPHPIR